MGGERSSWSQGPGLAGRASGNKSADRGKWPLSGRATQQIVEAGSALFSKLPARPVLVQLSSGWASCCRYQNNGSRTILDFILPGEFIYSAQVDAHRETVVAMSDIRLLEIQVGNDEASPVDAAFQEAALATVLMENSRLAQRLVMIGRRDAFERIAVLFLELAVRSGARPSKGSLVFNCPLIQADIGDAVGLSTVHVNRVLKELRTRNLLSMRNGMVEIFDFDELVTRVDFERDYLLPVSG